MIRARAAFIRACAAFIRMCNAFMRACAAFIRARVAFIRVYNAFMRARVHSSTCSFVVKKNSFVFVFIRRRVGHLTSSCRTKNYDLSPLYRVLSSNPVMTRLDFNSDAEGHVVLVCSRPAESALVTFGTLKELVPHVMQPARLTSTDTINCAKPSVTSTL